jgi:hypothetical protein
MRRILPPRRGAVSFNLVHQNRPVTVTAGFYANGALGEVFIGVGKTGADIENIAHDAAVILSLAIQHGVAIESIQRAVTRLGDGAPSSVLGAVADSLAGAVRP